MRNELLVTEDFVEGGGGGLEKCIWEGGVQAHFPDIPLQKGSVDRGPYRPTDRARQGWGVPLRLYKCAGWDFRVYARVWGFRNGRRGQVSILPTMR